MPQMLGFVLTSRRARASVPVPSVAERDHAAWYPVAPGRATRGAGAVDVRDGVFECAVVFLIMSSAAWQLPF